MKIIKTAIAGTLESGDVQIMISPNEEIGLEINLNSIVKAQFGNAIMATVMDVLKGYDIDKATVQIQDKGAFDCVIRSRMQTAVCRASGNLFDWKRVE
ncbi:citrate lyase acyl carrier protein [Acidaminobacter hydrogenoformans]|uniref:Citrate lyase acyl carrier protein n=1 Tax=Acidaminobacter hydrogenoformans DSM 2784 TaxID=1120920 RepID=A0A1G5RXN8_9FIRM|nr:citrate lyase acyl carrier protein [Acidaminobacter hydrogenoformans]SCZ78677.1 citrate lyase subunit gamma (acyl carrier protein) [Acidaminobacter hydrogenoformans DSM 2784]